MQPTPGNSVSTPAEHVSASKSSARRQQGCASAAVGQLLLRWRRGSPCEPGCRSSVDRPGEAMLDRIHSPYGRRPVHTAHRLLRQVGHHRAHRLAQPPTSPGGGGQAGPPAARPVRRRAGGGAGHGPGGGSAAQALDQGMVQRIQGAGHGCGGGARRAQPTTVADSATVVGLPPVPGGRPPRADRCLLAVAAPRCWCGRASGAPATEAGGERGGTHGSGAAAVRRSRPVGAVGIRRAAQARRVQASLASPSAARGSPRASLRRATPS